MTAKNTELRIIKQRTIKDTKNVFIKAVLFEDGQRFIVATNLHNGTATTHIYNLLGFDEVGDYIYDPYGMRIGRSEAAKARDGYIKHFDKFYFKIEKDKAKYERIKEAFKPYAGE